MSHAIQHLVMPNMAFGAPEEMYVRLSNDRVHALMSEGRLLFDAGGRASFDTFFNSVTVQAWKDNTAVADLQLHLRGTGRFIVRLGLHRIGHAQRWLQEQVVTLNPESDLILDVQSWAKLESGMLYFALEALEPGSLTSGHFATCTAPQRDVKLGIVITHFNRKQWVLPAIARIRDELLSDPRYQGRIELIVVDNSQNITQEEAQGITLIPNKNLGGSGGFTRGLLHLKDSGDFTHCLFMDDDASCEIESIRRAFNFFINSTKEKLAVSGALLRDLEPFRIHEKGGMFIDGRWAPAKHGLDIRHVDGLLSSEDANVKANYGAWWFFAFDIEDVRSFAFPFFVRGDDAQFSLQNKFNIFTLNGIACWGEDFWYKESPLTRYLGTRATLLILIALSNVSVFYFIKTILSWCLSSLFSYNYSSARAVLMAVEDIMKGPIFFERNIDASDVRKTISLKCPGDKLDAIDLRNYELTFKSGQESKFRKLVRSITLNGIFIPNFFMNNGVVYQPKFYRASFREIFRFKKIVYEYKPMNVGYVAAIDRKKFVQTLLKFSWVLLVFVFKINSLKNVYRANWENMTSEKFWRDVYSR